MKDLRFNICRHHEGDFLTSIKCLGHYRNVYKFWADAHDLLLCLPVQ